ncbi:MAG TPA: CHAT domain-containing protein [Thermoanaerobaculia bacterium]|jgi:CHAT domain-containing protein|nr:CHAT domain-containing protein [Thermoanaerobaculia bacterium]
MSRELTAASARVARTILAVFLVIALPACRKQESASDHLRELAPRSARPIEARLTGFDWQAMQLQRATPAGLLDPARLDLAGAAGTVIQSDLNNPSAYARHESGAAYLLIERDRDAIDALESAVLQSPGEAAYWSDLAAARYTHAVREKRPHELPQALADADHALRIEPALPDALFNRALIVEALGITEAARRAWQRYADVDPSTHWTGEAMNHLGRLGVVRTRDEFQRQLDLASLALRDGDHGPIAALARNHPQEARTWSEGPLLGNWADAVRAGKTNAASDLLSVIREMGSALGQFNHDESISDAVAAVDRVAADPARVRALADAQAIYRDGRLLYRERRIADAQKKFQEAEKRLAGGGSPTSLMAAYYLAGCLFDSDQPVQATVALDRLAARFDHDRYPGLLAGIGWNRSLCHAGDGEWSAAIRTAGESRRIFAGLGETENRGEMDLLIASCLNRAAQPAAAWKARVAAFQVLSRAGSDDRIRNSLNTAMNVETEQGNVDQVLSLAHLALDDLRQLKLPSAVCVAEAYRAEALAKSGDTSGARVAVKQARATAKKVPDVAMRRRTSVSLDIVEAVVERRANFRLSLRLLDDAVAFSTSEGLSGELPRAYLERGRTRVSGGDDSAALADFEAGLAAVEKQRSSISDRSLRGTFYDSEPALFSETIGLLLRHGDQARAFEYSDRARARSMYEQLGRTTILDMATTAEQLRGALPPGTVLVEYALLPDAIVTFYFTSSRSGVVRVPASPANVRALVEQCVDLVQHRGDIEAVYRSAAALHRLLIAPVAAELAGADRLIIVPDRQLHTVPWAALWNAPRGHYLIDDMALSVAPSASALLLKKQPAVLAPVLVIGDPHDEGAASLPEAAREAEVIAAMYGSSTLLESDHATRARFVAAARMSGMIHYAGHAESDATDPFGALHLAADHPHETGDLDTTDIAALRLEKAPLVLLAACGTMRGESGHVEGMPSIARAFLAAGARGVIGTLWEVDDDAAAPLFHRLHLELRNGASPSAALRTAQIELAHGTDPRLGHPASWAPVELLGYSTEQATSPTKGSQ